MRIDLNFQEPSEADSLMTDEFVSKRDDEFDDETSTDLWMTSTQFSQLLDKQEAAETPNTLKYEKNNTSKTRYSSVVNGGKIFRRSSIASSSGSSSAFSRLPPITLNNLNHSSFLDNDAKIPFCKLKQVRKVRFAYLCDNLWIHHCRVCAKMHKKVFAVFFSARKNFLQLSLSSSSLHPEMFLVLITVFLCIPPLHNYVVRVLLSALNFLCDVYIKAARMHPTTTSTQRVVCDLDFVFLWFSFVKRIVVLFFLGKQYTSFVKNVSLPPNPKRLSVNKPKCRHTATGAAYPPLLCSYFLPQFSLPEQLILLRVI